MIDVLIVQLGANFNSRTGVTEYKLIYRCIVVHDHNTQLFTVVTSWVRLAPNVIKFYTVNLW